MPRNEHLIASFVLITLLIAGICCPGWSASAPLPINNNLAPIWENLFKKIDAAKNIGSFSGRTVGDDSAFVALQRNWKYRMQCYEIYFSSQVELARSIYGLAITSGDIKPDISLERFVKGVQGFHYDMEQLCTWVSKINNKEISFYTQQEIQLISWLFDDGVLTVKNGFVAATGKVQHFSGASPGSKRTLMQALTHERLHVMWDEDNTFRQHALNSWHSLSNQERQQVNSSLPGYAQDHEIQIIEEWWVRQTEKISPEAINQLLGVTP